MATNAMDGLAEVYRAVTPPLPVLFVWNLPVLGNRPALPYALLINAPGEDQLQVQRNPGSGGAGLRHEVLMARFFVWSIDPPTADAASSALTVALHPLAVVFDGAKTVTEVMDTSVFEERHRPPRGQARPIPRGDEVVVDRVYVANTDVKVRIVYD
jgi:hypothetical protein